MKYQLRQHGWPIGQHLIPEGAIIDTVSGTDGWSKLAQGLNPPPNAQPLDQATYDAMKKIYPAEQIITVPGADGINR